MAALVMDHCPEVSNPRITEWNIYQRLFIWNSIRISSMMKNGKLLHSLDMGHFITGDNSNLVLLVRDKYYDSNSFTKQSKKRMGRYRQIYCYYGCPGRPYKRHSLYRKKNRVFLLLQCKSIYFTHGSNHLLVFFKKSRNRSMHKLDQKKMIWGYVK